MDKAKIRYEHQQLKIILKAKNEAIEQRIKEIKQYITELDQINDQLIKGGINGTN